MKIWNKKKSLAVVFIVFLVTTLAFFTSSEKEVDYSVDVKPIINKQCISCHGGVKAKAGFSLLFREEALAKAESGKYAIVPGDPDASEMIRRITHSDPEERMPYKHEPLSEEEISILKRWIKQGAKWGDHWAYLPVKQTKVPEVDDQGWSVNNADKFIYEKLQEMELEPSPAADKATILRRVSLDVIGMYPSEKIANQFLSSNDPKAYEQLVDTLLASKHFGERWASMWLDIARYADSKGYESDIGRSIWKYRDWVIDAFNSDQPYDKFLEQQMAGDLLPGADEEQFIATAFHRNSMTNDEGGTSNEEFRMAAVIDRVNTTWEGVMGTTFSCVQCHSHPYDPFRHEEFYSFLAYFNNTRDEDQYPKEYPLMRLQTPDQKSQVEHISQWVSTYGSKEDAEATKILLKTLQPAIYPSAADTIVNGYISGNNAELVLHANAYFKFSKFDLHNYNVLLFGYHMPLPGGEILVRAGSPKGEILGRAKLAATKKLEMHELVLKPVDELTDLYFDFQNPSLSGDRAKNAIHLEYISLTKNLPGKDKPGYAETKNAYWKILTQQPDSTIPVMLENPAFLKRKTHVFDRGNRLLLGKEVSAGVPAIFAAAMPPDAPKDRRGLAMWLTNKQNPLVSRTMVNRIWEQLFGTGIVETLEDMGTQGIVPTHREMLDHYSWVFMNDYKWSLKKLIKEFVMSATYRQDSKTNEQLKDKDPYNKYYARGPRIRLSAEQLRDQHLSVSGIMSEKMYGPGVMPWQPDGLWSNPYNSESWKNSEGEDQYRRAVYTYIKRSSTYPALTTFDGTSRNVCSARRIRTNTPLQALLTLNDSAFLDMATHFAGRMMEAGGSDPKKQIEKGYELLTYKKMPAPKLEAMVKLYNQALSTFSASDSSAVKFVGAADKNKLKEKAALKVVANAMFNLDEAITKN